MIQNKHKPKLSVFAIGIILSISAVIFALASSEKDNKPAYYQNDYNFHFELKRLAPPKLAWDWYPNGLTRKTLLKKVKRGIKKTGYIAQGEVWEGIIHITGDLTVAPDANITVKPGTIVFVSALSDDQHKGGRKNAKPDPMNPKKPPNTFEYCQNRISIEFKGGFFAKGTKENPIIITSDSKHPTSDDWLALGVSGRSKFEWALIEFCRIFSPGNMPSMKLSKCIVRNMLESFLVGESCESSGFVISNNGKIEKSYIYNIGQGLQIRWGKMKFKNNIIFMRPDQELFNFPSYEYGGISNDFPTQLELKYNYIEAGPYVYYDDYVMGNYIEYIEPDTLTFFGFDTNSSKIIRNTIYYPSSALNEENPHPPIRIYHSGRQFYDNNLLVHRTRNLLGVFGEQELKKWESPCHYEAAKLFPMSEPEIFSAKNNYWGSSDETSIVSRFRQKNITYDIKPIHNTIVKNAFPKWKKFSWLDINQNTIPPIAIAVRHNIALTNEQTSFSGSQSYDPDGEIAEYFWIFEDWETSSEANPTYTFAQPGIYRVGLIVRDNDYKWSENISYLEVIVQ